MTGNQQAGDRGAQARRGSIKIPKLVKKAVS
jgi:hypothetical protein